MNYYEILKVPRSASEQQIKSAYKKLVKQYHPDLYIGDKAFAEHKIKEINEAYAVLSNAETKLAYDEYWSSITSTTYDSSAIESNISNPSQTPEPVWSFSKFITDKVNQLDQKVQLQIFIAIFVSFLALLLLNWLQMKEFLNHSTTTNEPSSVILTENETNDFAENTFSDDNFYHNEDLKKLDDLFYDFFKSYEF